MRSADLFVVETADNIYLGTITRRRGAIIIHNGYVGRPVVVPRQDVEAVTLAADHPLVESA